MANPTGTHDDMGAWVDFDAADKALWDARESLRRDCEDGVWRGGYGGLKVAALQLEFRGLVKLATSLGIREPYKGAFGHNQAYAAAAARG